MFPISYQYSLYLFSNTGLPEKLLKCFSVYTNIPRVLAARRSPGNIDCLHGIRFISMSWIILGHTFNYGVLSNVEMPTSG